MGNSPPQISLSGSQGQSSIPIPGPYDGNRAANGHASPSASDHLSASGNLRQMPANTAFPASQSTLAAFPGYSASPAPSFGDSLHPDNSVFASSPSRPPVAGTSPDMANISADYSEYMSPEFAAHDGSLSLGTGNLAPGAANPSGRRMRSGSLFSTHSIWNDDAHSSNSQSHHSSTGTALDFFQEMGASGPSSISSFLSPSLAPQPSSLLPNPSGRNRSHTTSGTIHAFPAHQPDAGRVGSSPFLYPVPNESAPAITEPALPNIHEIPSLTTRNRSQTYSGVKPKVPHAALPSFMPSSVSSNPSVSSVATSQFTQLPPNASLGSNSLNSNSLAPNAGPFAAANSLSEKHDPLPFAAYPKPHLQDDCDLFSLQLTTSFDNSSLGPTNTLLLDNVPHFLDAAKLYSLLCKPATGYQHYQGRTQVLSVRVASTSNSKMALVVCPSVEVAMGLKANFNHLEIVPGVILYVAFAKVSEKPQQMHPAVNTMAGTQRVSPPPHQKVSPKSSVEPEEPRAFVARATDVDILTVASSILETVSYLSPSQNLDLKKIFSIMQNSAKFPKAFYQKSFGPLPEGLTIREFDSPKLRELRKSLENNEKVLQGKSVSPSDSESEPKIMSQLDLEALSLAMLPELPELCYDHIGNTIVQKIVSLLESPVVKLIMVKEIAPYLTQLGTHKNGTWAIQKIINLCDQDCKQKVIIADSLRPYAVKMFNDQFGNYVLQCCLKFDSPFNDFIFETLCNNFLEISSGRFGARCIRTILETAHDSKNGAKTISQEQLFLVAGLIVEYFNELILNSNGSLLITWFLDTFTESRKASPDPRYELLCRRLVPNLVSLCKHKLAHLTVLKIVSNRNDMVTRQRLLDCLFDPFTEYEEQYKPPSRTLEAILKEGGDNTYGPAFVHKLVSNPAVLAVGSESYNQRYQQYVLNQVKRVLLEMNIGNLQPYKKLIDEVGLSSSRLNWTSSGGRKGKRSGNLHGRSGKQYPHQAYGGAQHDQGQAQSYPGNFEAYPYQEMMAPSESYANGEGYANGDRYTNGEGYANGSYFPPPMANYNHYQHEAHVMRQLEQLSLSSAAMGYTSNPGTPGARNFPHQESFF